MVGKKANTEALVKRWRGKGDENQNTQRFKLYTKRISE